MTWAVLQFPSRESGCWVKGPALTSFSLTVESELLNKLSIPAHFVALNGNKLNVNLKTGSEVRVSGPVCCGGRGSPCGNSRNVSLHPLALTAFSI